MGEGQLLSVGMSLTAHKQLNGMSMCLSTKLCNPIVWACRIIGADVQGKRSRISFFSLSILSLKFFFTYVAIPNRLFRRVFRAHH